MNETNELAEALKVARELSTVLSDLIAVGGRCGGPERRCVERIGARLVRLAHDAICGPTPAAELRPTGPESPGDALLDPNLSIPFEMTGMTPDGDEMGEGPPPAPDGFVGSLGKVRRRSGPLAESPNLFDGYARMIARRRGCSVARVRRAMGAQLELEGTSLADLIGLGRLLAFIKAVIALLESDLF